MNCCYLMVLNNLTLVILESIKLYFFTGINDPVMLHSC
jgi:hypothetical protein